MFARVRKSTKRTQPENLGSSLGSALSPLITVLSHLSSLSRGLCQLKWFSRRTPVSPGSLRWMVIPQSSFPPAVFSATHYFLLGGSGLVQWWNARSLSSLVSLVLHPLQTLLSHVLGSSRAPSSTLTSFLMVFFQETSCIQSCDEHP